MMGTKYVFIEKYGQLFLNYSCYSALSGALSKASNIKNLELIDFTVQYCFQKKLSDKMTNIINLDETVSHT